MKTFLSALMACLFTATGTARAAYVGSVSTVHELVSTINPTGVNTNYFVNQIASICAWVGGDSTATNVVPDGPFGSAKAIGRWFVVMKGASNSFTTLYVSNFFATNIYATNIYVTNLYSSTIVNSNLYATNIYVTNLYSTNIIVNGTNVATLGDLLWTNSAGILQPKNLTLPLLWTNQVYFNTSMSNALYSSGSALWFTNYAPVSDVAAFKVGRGLGYWAEYGVNSSGSAFISSSETNQPVWIRAGGNQGGVMVGANSMTPVSGATISLGIASAGQVFTDQHFRGTEYQYGFIDMPNYSRLATYQTSTNDPAIFNIQTFGSGINGANQGFSFRTNNTVIFQIASASGYSGTGTNMFTDDGTFKPLGSVSATNVLWDAVLNKPTMLVSNNVASAALLSVDATKTNGIAATAAHITNAWGIFNGNTNQYVNGAGVLSIPPGGVDTNANYAWNGQHTFAKTIVSGTNTAVSWPGYPTTAALMSVRNAALADDPAQSLELFSVVDDNFNDYGSLEGDISTNASSWKVVTGTGNPSQESGVYIHTSSDNTSIDLETLGTTFAFLNPDAADGSTAFKLGTSATHTSGSLFDVENNATNQFSIAAVTGWTGTGANFFADDGTFKSSGAGALAFKSSFSTNFTVTSAAHFYMLSGTNQVITLPSAASSSGMLYRFSSTNGRGSFIISNSGDGAKVRDGISQSYTNIGINEVGFVSDGSNWWLASKGKTVMPSASWSLTNTITPVQDVITNIPFTTLEFNNSQGISLTTNGWGTFTFLNITNAGTYMITFSAVLKGSGGGTKISIWLRQAGVDVPRTRTDQGFTGATAQQCMTVNYFVSVGASPTYFELVAASHDASPPTIESGTPNPTGYTAPAMPGVIVTINRVSDSWP